MQRRPFLKAAAGSLAALFGYGKSSQAKAAPLCPLGCARTFRKDAHGEFREVDRRTVKAGDEVAMFGINEKTGRLWKFVVFIAASDFQVVPNEDPFGQLVHREGTLKQLV